MRGAKKKASVTQFDLRKRNDKKRKQIAEVCFIAFKANGVNFPVKYFLLNAFLQPSNNPDFHFYISFTLTLDGSLRTRVNTPPLDTHGSRRNFIFVSHSVKAPCARERIMKENWSGKFRLNWMEWKCTNVKFDTHSSPSHLTYLFLFNLIWLSSFGICLNYLTTIQSDILIKKPQKVTSINQKIFIFFRCCHTQIKNHQGNNSILL